MSFEGVECVVVTNLTVKVWFVEQHFKVRKNLVNIFRQLIKYHDFRGEFHFCWPLQH